jgi:hypothetical protein
MAQGLSLLQGVYGIRKCGVNLMEVLNVISALFIILLLLVHMLYFVFSILNFIFGGWRRVGRGRTRDYSGPAYGITSAINGE